MWCSLAGYWYTGSFSWLKPVWVGSIHDDLDPFLWDSRSASADKNVPLGPISISVSWVYPGFARLSPDPEPEPYPGFSLETS